MQCILTRDLYDLFYGGDATTSGTTSGSRGVSGGRRRQHGAATPSLAQSFTCPLCTRLGFSETSLAEHVASQHAEATQEVVCPICAAKPGVSYEIMNKEKSGN
jgi:transcription elongation factor Elf1